MRMRANIQTYMHINTYVHMKTQNLYFEFINLADTYLRRRSRENQGFRGRKTRSLETKPNRSDINKVKHSSKPTVTQNPKL